tara:strand:- start:1605 stop:2069 length:465 start_codon:yes stop_codon:yes gene_type:complete
MIDESIEILMHAMRFAYKRGKELNAEKYYKELRKDFGIDLFYEVEFPAHVKFVHPLGTVLGRATYGDYLVCYHNVTVGSGIDEDEYPVIGEGACLFSGARVIGPVTIGNNVWVSPNTVVTRCDVPDNSVVFPALGRSGCEWKPTTRSVRERFFK